MNRLIAPHSGTGPRAITGAAAEFSIEAGRFDVRSWLAWPERRVDLRGWADTGGTIEYLIPPEALFSEDFLLRYGDRMAPGWLRVSGYIFAPQVVLPDPIEWNRMADQGRIDQAIREFLSR